MWTLGAFMFLGAVTGVLEISDMGVLDIINENSLPPSPTMRWGWGGHVPFPMLGSEWITLARIILICVETVYRLLMFFYRFASPVFGLLEAEGCGYCHYAQEGHGGA